MKRMSSEMSHTTKQERPEKKMKFAYMGDPRLMPRVQQYLEAHRDKKVIDLIAMADELQSKHGEYGRKKRAAFRKTVEKAYEHILRTSPQTFGKESDRKRQAGEANGGDSGEDSREFSDDNPDYTTYEDKNAMNSLMRNFYSKPGSRPGSRPSSQPGSGANTPVGSRSPYRPSQPDTIPTPLFTVDRTGNKDLKDSLTSKSKTPTSSPKPKVKQSLVSGQHESRTVGLLDLMSDSDEEKITSSRKRPLHSATTPGNESGVSESSSSQREKSIPKDVIDSNEKVSTPKLKTKAEDTTARPSVKKKRRQDPDEEKKKKGPEITQSKVTFADIGGNDKMLAEVCQLLVHMKHPEVYRQLGVTPPRGLLLHGPPGCGKTLLAHAIAGELELAFLKVAATEVVSGVSGESEEKVRDTFQKAMTNAPCVLFIDEIDAITQKRENASKDMERRIVSQLLTCMDELNTCQTGHVLVIGATNRPDSLDPALRRAGRFDREISLGIPDQAARQRILSVLCRTLRLTPGLDLAVLARLTPGYVGADLMALTREAAITAVNRVFKRLQESTEAKESRESDSSHEQTHPSTVDASPASPTTAQTAAPGLAPPVEQSTHEGVECDTNSNVEGDVEMAEPATVTTSREEHQAPSLERESGGEQLTQAQARCTDSEVVPARDGAESSESAERALVNGDVERGRDAVEDIKSGEDVQESTNSVEKKDNAFLKGLQQVAKKNTGEEQDLASMLSWLKDHPPLTEEQLDSLWIKMTDFEAATRVVQPSAKREGFATIPDVTWSDIGALHEVRDELQMAILAPVRHPEQFAALGLTSPPGVLLAGPPGCGKTLLAKAVANESGINFISVKGPELLNMYVGESERAVRQVFQRARNSAPCVIFFDELDALCPRRSDGGEGGSSVRVVNQLLTEMDGLEDRKQVFIMGATNRPDIIDPAVLRPGRLDKTLYVGLPTPSDRQDILRTLTKNGSKPRLLPDVNLSAIGSDSRCDGYTGADLAALVREAAVTALREFMSRPQGGAMLEAVVGTQHFDIAFSKIRPSVSEKERLKYERMNHRLRP